MSDNKWEDKIKTKLENRHETVPDFLWQKIEKDLPPVRTRRKTLYNLYRNIAAIAAIVILAWTAFMMFDTNDKHHDMIAEKNEDMTIEEIKDIKNIAPITNKTYQAFVIEKKKKEKTSKDNPLMAVAITNKEAQPKEHKNVNMSVSDNDITDTNENKDTDRRITANTVENQNEKELFKNNEDHKHVMSKNNSNKTNSNKKKKWSVSIETGNTFRNNGSTNMGLSAFSAKDMLQTNDISTYKTMLMTSAVNTPQTSVKHYFPITGALTLRKYITDRLSVESGLQYTMLKTDIKTGATSYCLNKQKLQYIGLPVKVSYDIVNKGGLIIYTSGGGAVEGCISAKNYKEYYIGSEKIKNEIENLNIKRTQWSVNASVGIQYNIIRQIGIYAEPGITYYFDDGNQIESIRKEHPMNFQLKAGIRLNL